MSEAVLEVRNLVKYFGKRKVIDNVSFEVLPGEIFGFLGPNGAGKTTTIKMIMGFLSVDEGEILINGVTLRKDYEKAMSSIGGIVENPEMYKDLSGQINLEMYARLHDGVTKERIREVVALVGMQNRINDKVKKYSLGMKQRVGLAQSILHRPKILILDEPTNGLDPAGIKELRDIFKKLAHEEGVAVFVSSHLLSEMQLMCDRVGIISNGRLLGVKPIQQLMTDATGGVFYRFQTKQSELAASVLTQDYADKITDSAPDYIELRIEESDVPEVTRQLALNGVAIFGVNKFESSLEDAFISMTGGGNSIA
ncbi:MAG: ABC transporter ATP-binding protein [Saccharofermentanales bacterium]